MARRTPNQRTDWSSWSRLRAKGPAQIDLCKINTDAFRHLDADQLQLAHTRVGWGVLPKSAETKADRASGWRKVPRKGPEINALLGRYISKLREIRSPLFLSQDSIEEFWRRHPRRPISDADSQANKENILALKAERDPRREAARIETQIWDLQARAACSIKPSEQIARDAMRSEPPRVKEAARIRKKAIIR